LRFGRYVWRQREMKRRRSRKQRELAAEGVEGVEEDGCAGEEKGGIG
jgi:hypothetical protein